MIKEIITDWDDFASLASGQVKTKVCIKCKRDLPLSKYNTHGGNSYLRTECAVCNNKLNSTRKKLKKTAPPPPLNHLCPICKCNEEEAHGRGGKKSPSWVIDHDHTNKFFRGWLCHTCNRAIGNFGEDIDRMHRAIEYLKQF